MYFSCEKYSQHIVGLILLGGYKQPSILSNLSAMKVDSLIANYENSGCVEYTQGAHMHLVH